MESQEEKSNKMAQNRGSQISKVIDDNRANVTRDLRTQVALNSVICPFFLGLWIYDVFFIIHGG